LTDVTGWKPILRVEADGTRSVLLL
jgi:hypothetical protein